MEGKNKIKCLKVKDLNDLLENYELNRPKTKENAELFSLIDGLNKLVKEKAFDISLDNKTKYTAGLNLMKKSSFSGILKSSLSERRTRKFGVRYRDKNPFGKKKADDITFKKSDR